MTIQEYISEIQKQFATGVAREHTYRPALQQLLSSLLPHLVVSNEPKREDYGVPDYILMRPDTRIPIAFVEAKDIDDSDLAGKNKHKEQFTRYRSSLDNIIFTDYLDFRLYEKGEFVDSIRIANVSGNKIVAQTENFEQFKHLIEHFGNANPQKITRSSQLAEIMAGKARLLANVIERVLLKDDDEDGNLRGQMEAFKSILIHDISPKDFADVYAQTITYGMFAARLHDTTPETFSRNEAATLIPRTNPFLRQLFQYVAGYDLDERICWIVDDLAETFRATDMQKIMSGYGTRTKQTDPMIHFYEDFLSAYDPNLRKSRGVWYTPQAVVNFIVRAVDEILQKEFGLPTGLADTSKITIDQSVLQSRDKRYSDGKKKLKREFHRVQILDPATGTGTFLAEVVSQIHAKFQDQAGMWQSYVDEHLLPRLNGFELLMASYAMAHLKIDWLLTETGYKAIGDKRLRIFLTNALEEYHKDTGTLFAQFLAREANGANEIKRDTPVMVVLGNPPYRGISQNNGEWISKLIDDYKYIDGVHFKERKHWLNDDYVKFIRLGQSFVDKNNEGILAYINNHNFLDNPTFRGMRWNLLKSFDKIYILDLHGNSKKKEVCPDGSKDENVFDIQQGVSINIFIKTGEKSKNGFAEVFHHDVWGKRQAKYDFLASNDLYSLNFKEVKPTAPFYFFVPKDETGRDEYEKGFCINELMPINATGVVTMGDSFALAESAEGLHNRLNDFIDTPYDSDTLNRKYNLGKNYADFILKSNIKNISEDSILPIAYRPFDTKYIYFDDRIVWRPRSRVMNHLLYGNNIGLVFSRQAATNNWSHVQIVNTIIDNRLHYSSKGTSLCSPLYLYDNMSADIPRHPNLKQEIVDKIAADINLGFESEKSGDKDKFAPIDLLDYIYAVLHSPAYRKKYQEFLKTDFPRVPYPASADEFHRLSGIGSELRRIHLMEHPELDKFITRYPVIGSNTIEKVRWEASSEKTGRVWINDEQYFDNVPLAAWEFYIGGYQPAQKWLKDRTGQDIGYDDIRHYHRIIKALIMTNEKMETI